MDEPIEQATANPGEKRQLPAYEVRVIQPGDKVIIELSGNPSLEQMKMMRETLADLFPDHRVAVVCGGTVMVEPAR